MSQQGVSGAGKVTGGQTGRNEKGQGEIKPASQLQGQVVGNQNMRQTGGTEQESLESLLDRLCDSASQLEGLNIFSRPFRLLWLF